MTYLWNILKCFFIGHDYDWEEYEKRIEKEEHHGAYDMVFCKRCMNYKTHCN
jgi:hypothetical protein